MKIRTCSRDIEFLFREIHSRNLVSNFSHNVVQLHYLIVANDHIRTENAKNFTKFETTQPDLTKRSLSKRMFTAFKNELQS